MDIPQSKQDFINIAKPAAAQAAAELGVPAGDTQAFNAAIVGILSQWVAETGWGLDPGARKNLGRNNLAGIKCHSGCQCDSASGYCQYPDLQSFASDYAKVMQNGSYNNLITDLKTGNLLGFFQDLHTSPWAEGGYAGINFQDIAKEVVQYVGGLINPQPIPVQQGELERICGASPGWNVLGWGDWLFCALKLELKYIAVNVFVFVIIVILLNTLVTKVEQESPAVRDLASGARRTGRQAAQAGAAIAKAAAL